MKKCLILTVVFTFIICFVAAQKADREGKAWLAQFDEPPEVNVNGKWKYYDPVTNNDFWWQKNQKLPVQAGALPTSRHSEYTASGAAGTLPLF